MHVTRRYLDWELARWHDSCQLWCGQRHVSCDTATRLAHLSLTVPCLSRASIVRLELPDSTPRVLPEVSCLQDQGWQELCGWRLPQTGLSLLQVALLCGHREGLAFLCLHPGFKAELLYRDASSRLVNHPLHLSLFVGSGFQRFLWEMFYDFSESVFREEGTVDLSTAKVQITNIMDPNKTSVNVNNSFLSAIINVSHQERNKNAGTSVARENDKNLLNVLSAPQTISPLLPAGKGCGVWRAYHLLHTVYKKIIRGKAGISTVEDLWQVMRHWHSGGMPEDLYDKTLKSLASRVPRTFAEDTLLLACLLAWTVRRFSRPAPHKGKNDDVSISALEDSPSLTRLLTLCKQTAHAQSACRAAVLCLPASLRPSYSALYCSRRRPAESSPLQQLSMLAVLELVQGDVVAVRNMECLPVPLRQLFPLPFQTLYSELKKNELN